MDPFRSYGNEAVTMSCPSVWSHTRLIPPRAFAAGTLSARATCFVFASRGKQPRISARIHAEPIDPALTRCPLRQTPSAIAPLFELATRHWVQLRQRLVLHAQEVVVRDGLAVLRGSGCPGLLRRAGAAPRNDLLFVRATASYPVDNACVFPVDKSAVYARGVGEAGAERQREAGAVGVGHKALSAAQTAPGSSRSGCCCARRRFGSRLKWLPGVASSG